MKKACVAVLISLICIFSISYIEFNIYKNVSIKNQSEALVKKAYTMIEQPIEKKNSIFEGVLNKRLNYINNINAKKNNNVDTIEHTKENVICDDDIIGILLIPKLRIEAPIRDGTSQKVMENSVGHFCESDYWDGNVSFASHNSGISAHFFAKINLLNENDEIVYKTKLGTKIYKVQSISRIKSTDWSMIVKNGNDKNNSKNTITLVTCINGFPDYRLCVRGEEIT